MPDARYQITWRVRRLFKLMAERSEGYLAEFGISSPERAVIEHLSGWGHATVPDMARMLYVSRQSIQVRINKLKKKGWVAACDNPAHARSDLMRLTAEGKKQFAAIQAREAGVIEAMFDGMADADIKTTDRVLKTLSDRLLHDIEDSGNDESKDE